MSLDTSKELTQDFGLFYPREGGEDFIGYCDADWGTCSYSGRSLTGYCLFIGGCLVSWKTKKQKVTSNSSCEAEFRSMSMTTDEIAWITGLFEDFKQEFYLCSSTVTISQQSIMRHFMRGLST